MRADTDPATYHREIAGGFTALVDSAPAEAWEAPAPVEGWTARDVVRHLVEWFPPFLAGGTGIVLPPGPSVDDDPVGAWRSQAEAVQALLDDPASAERVLTNPHLGEVPLPTAVSRFYSTDVFLHTWDLARATGRPADLDPELAAELLAGMEPMEEVLRASGQYGPRVEVAPDADPVTRLAGFIGRDPSWPT